MKAPGSGHSSVDKFCPKALSRLQEEIKSKVYALVLIASFPLLKFKPSAIR
jgi:hypothetical protein